MAGEFDELDARQQEIIKEKLGEEASGGEPELPSDKANYKFAGVYGNVDELKKGIQNLDKDIPENVLDGMSDKALEFYYKQKNLEYQAKKNPNNPNYEGKKKDVKSTEQKAAEDAGLDWTKLESEYNTDGSLSDNTFKELKKAGIPKQMVDSYIAGLDAQNQLFTEKMYSMAGGEEEFNTIKTWAEDNLSESEIDTISNLPQAQALLAMEGVKARYEKANGSSIKPTRVTGSTSNSSGVGYNSKEEYMKDVSDRRYLTNQKFAEAVDTKLARSNF